MKKIYALLLLFCMSALPAFSDSSKDTPLRVIPFPESADTQSEGASAAPANINHKDSAYFDTKTDFFEAKSTESRVILTHYPTYQQTTEYTCGPAAALTVLYYFGVKDYTEAKLAVEMKTQGYPIGTSTKDMLAFFDSIGWQTQSSLKHERFDTYESFAKFVKDTLSEGTPILVENVYWGGHWRVIIGFDNLSTESSLDDTLILADPYDTCDHNQDGYAVENAENFYATWFDHSVIPEDERDQPFIVAKPK